MKGGDGGARGTQLKAKHRKKDSISERGGAKRLVLDEPINFGGISIEREERE